jgi:hypothetical protein
VKNANIAGSGNLAVGNNLTVDGTAIVTGATSLNGGLHMNNFLIRDVGTPDPSISAQLTCAVPLSYLINLLNSYRTCHWITVTLGDIPGSPGTVSYNSSTGD